jgi:AMP-polyphosphate phosphotransferase
MQQLSLSQLLKNYQKLTESKKHKAEKEIPKLQLDMLKIQQGIFHNNERAIIVLEGFDAAGKGSAIRSMTEILDPRSFRVHAIGAPTAEEQGRHWLYRFWTNLPKAGRIAVFDRSWYGRVLVEKVEKLTPENRLKEAYSEINQFEKMLISDGIKVIKIFIAITKDEQLERFEDRLKDPYKQWKITKDDIRARQMWDDYVKAVDEIFQKTNTKECPWHLVPGNSKKFAREEVLRIVTSELQPFERWMIKEASKLGKRKLEKALRDELN